MVMFVMVMASISLLIAMFTVYLDNLDADVTMPSWVRVVALRGLARLYCLHSTDNAIANVNDCVDEKVVRKDNAGVKPNVNVTSADASVVVRELRTITSLMKARVCEAKAQDEWKVLAKVVDRTLFWLCLLACCVYFIVFASRDD